MQLELWDWQQLVAEIEFHRHSHNWMDLLMSTRGKPRKNFEKASHEKYARSEKYVMPCMLCVLCYVQDPGPDGHKTWWT